MGRRFGNFKDGMREDILFLLKEKYNGDVNFLAKTWDFSDGELIDEVARTEGIEKGVPTIEELKADAYRQLKGTIARAADPQRLAQTIKILEDMKERTEDKDSADKAQSVAESIESLADIAPPEGLQDVSLNPVVSDHIKRPRRKKAKPSDEVNGLDENSDTP